MQMYQNESTGVHTEMDENKRNVKKKGKKYIID